MILFDLLCSQGHGFEAWFRDSDSFDRLAAVGEIACTVCGDTTIKKALMAPRISSSKATEGRIERDQVEAAAAAPAGQGGSAPPAGPPAASDPPRAVALQQNAGPLGEGASPPVPAKVAAAMTMLREVQTHIEKTFDHVGQRFAEEARKMHYGEAEKRSIYGEATKEEAAELLDEGIEVNQMPWLPHRNG